MLEGGCAAGEGCRDVWRLWFDVTRAPPSQTCVGLKKHKTASGGRNLEIWTMSEFLRGRPPGPSPRSLKPARKKLSLAGVDAEYIRKSRGAASLGLLCRLRGAPGQLCRLSRRAEKRPMHRHLAQTSAAYRARQPMAVDAGGRSSDTRRGRQLQLAVKGADLAGGVDDRMEHDDLGNPCHS